MKNNITIEPVVKNGWCTGCGTCAAICPQNAIEMPIDRRQGIYLPRINKEKCNECGLCFKVCPGYAVDYPKLNADIFSAKPKDVFLGNYLNCYTGHALDHDIRYNSASGGLITALLVFALEEGIIDGALVTRMKADAPLEPEPFIARTREDIILAAKSKYCPVPANIAIKEILQAQENQRFAVIGLPCHIQGIRKAEALNKKLRDKIVLHLGLFCNHTDGFRQTEFVLSKYHIKKDRVKSFQYRGRGWPGSVTIQLDDGTEKLIPCHEYIHWHTLWLYSPRGCEPCSDGTAELADASFGDAWLPEYRDSGLGESEVIVRSSVAADLINKAVEKGKIQTTPIKASKITASQKGPLYSKKIGSVARIRLFYKEKSVPSNTLKPGIIDRVFEIYKRTVCNLISSRLLSGIIKVIPIKLIYYFRLHLVALLILRMKSLIRKIY